MIWRTLTALPPIIGAITMAFVISRLVPANPIFLLCGTSCSAQQIAELTRDYGLDKSLIEQYFTYFRQLLSGNWGQSYFLDTGEGSGRGIFYLILNNLPNSLTLIILAQSLAFLLAIPIGVIAAANRGRWIDNALRIFAIFGTAVPAFWFGMVLQLLFGGGLVNILPISNYVDPRLLLTNPIPKISGSLLVDSALAGNLFIFREVAVHVILPVITLALFPMGLLTRQIRSAMIGVLTENYVRTAKAYGVPLRIVHFRWALKNAIIPAIVLIGLTLAGSIIGVFFVETVFGLPGIGTLAATAIQSLDYPLVLGVVIFVAVAFVTVNFVVDLLQAYIDRRIISKE